VAVSAPLTPSCRGTVVALAEAQEAAVIVDDLDIQPGKMSDAVERILDGGVATARRRGHGELST
jgi:hypothetical protein